MFCVQYFKSYGEIDNILETWRPFWIVNFHRFEELVKNAIPFFNHHYYVPNENKQKNHF